MTTCAPSPAGGGPQPTTDPTCGGSWSALIPRMEGGGSFSSPATSPRWLGSQASSLPDTGGVGVAVDVEARPAPEQVSPDDPATGPEGLPGGADRCVRVSSWARRHARCEEAGAPAAWGTRGAAWGKRGAQKASKGCTWVLLESSLWGETPSQRLFFLVNPKMKIVSERGLEHLAGRHGCTPPCLRVRSISDHQVRPAADSTGVSPFTRPRCSHS